MSSFEFNARTRVIFGAGELRRVGALARELGMNRVLIAADPGIVAAGHVERARRFLDMDAIVFSDFDANPDTVMVERGRHMAAEARVDGIIGLGGGSSMDCAKGINFVLTNGGTMRDYWGHGKASRPMLPMIGVPTTTGTGSEAQSYAIISDAETHLKMACGDAKAAFRVAVLDPELAESQPDKVYRQAGYDAISHAVESYVSTKGNAVSRMCAREAWRILTPAFDRRSIAEMQWGAYLAGMAIENAMLGAAHACANPLTKNYGVAHGDAIAVMLPHVVEWNADARYRELDGDVLRYVREARDGLPVSLGELNIPRHDLARLAGEAAQQWTGKFNPRPFDAAAALELYECAY